MNIAEIIYLILLWLLVGGYITLLFEVRKLKRSRDVFINFMTNQVEHNQNVFDYITHISNEIGKEENDN